MEFKMQVAHMVFPQGTMKVKLLGIILLDIILMKMAMVFLRFVIFFIFSFASVLSLLKCYTLLCYPIQVEKSRSYSISHKTGCDNSLLIHHFMHKKTKGN